MHVKPVDSETISDVLLGRAGLIAGSGVSVHSNLYRVLAQKLHHPDPDSVLSLKSLGEFLRSQGGDEAAARQRIRELYGLEKASPYLTTLAKPNWKSVLSLTLDTHLESRIQMEIDRKAARKPLTTITDLTAPVPPRCTPSFKLLGSLTEISFVLFEDEYLSSRAMWRTALESFCDALAGSPAICIGVDGDVEAFLDLVSDMLAAPKSRPSSLVFMNDCPMLQNRTLIRLLEKRIPAYAFQDSLSALVSRISAQERVGRTRRLPMVADKESLLDRYREICILVKPVDASVVGNVPKEALLDSLFSPSVPEWAAFSMNLDFRRDIESEVVETAKRLARENPEAHTCLAVTGSAANGKTTMLKRVAYELSSAEKTVIWVTASPLAAPERVFQEFFRDFRSELPETREVFVVIDDPLHSRAGETQHILRSSGTFGISVTLIIAVRSSEWATIDTTQITGHSTTVSEVCLRDDFSAEEVNRLAEYLCTIQVASSPQNARDLLRNAESTNARDVLNTLYVTVPHTRPVIVSSVRDEYCRLGDISGLKNKIKGDYEMSTGRVRDAYRCTSVANMYGCNLPFEVLRAAIGVEWSEARDLLATNSAVYGVLYTIETDDGTLLRCRNQIVTDTIVTLINGGPHGRIGEMSVLHSLIKACSGRSGLTYRNFIAKLLVGNPNLERLNYDEGRELYIAAIDAMAAPDRALVHHQGLWEDRHNHPAEALRLFKTALATPNYPYTERAEPESNIYTSMASAVLTQIRSGEKTLEVGRVEAEELLEKSRKGTVADAHAVHIGARISLELLRALNEDATASKLKIACDAVGEIDKLDILDNSPVAVRSRSKKSSGLLLEAREALYNAALPQADAKEMAEEVWQTSRSQDGFVVVARRELAAAREKGKGRDFNALYQYILQCRQQVREEGRYIDRRLSQIQVEVFYWWRIHRAMLSPIDIEINWQELLAIVQEIPTNDTIEQQSFFHFLQGLALAHLGDWDAANAVFARLRQSQLPPHVLWLPRAYLLNSKGGRRTVQGTVREYGGRTYLDLSDLGQSILVEKRDRWCAPGEIDHANVMFCFGGPRAVHDA
jgi:hypothetical protein